MKQLLILLLIIITTATTSCEKQSIIAKEDIPQKITEYVTTHFPENKIIHAFKVIDDFVTCYEVFLNDGFSLEFDRSFNIIEIKGNTKLPDSVIPEQIRNYIAKNFSNNYIAEWELENRLQTVELDNGFELEFSRDGLFVKIDD